MKFVLILAGMTFFQSAYALCSTNSGNLEDLKAQVSKVQKMRDGGSASEYDLLLAQKQVLELQLCQQMKRGFDLEAYNALAENAARRQALAENQWKGGTATAEEVLHVRAEVLGMNAECPMLAKFIENDYTSGNRSSQDLKTIQSTCKFLSSNAK
jgi:hypothetical protein